MYSIEQRDADLRGTTSAITYTLSFDRAPQHLVHVRMRVDRVAGDAVTLVMPSWSPGSYKIRDYAGHQGNVVAYVVKGGARTRVDASWRDKASLVVPTLGAEAIEVEYLVYCHERTVRTNHVNRFHAFLVPTAVCMYVEGRTQEIHHVRLMHTQTQWPSVSTALSPVVAPGADGVLLGALNYDILADSPIEIGDHQVRTFTAAGAMHEVAMPTNHALDIDWLTAQCERIVKVEAEIFGGVPYDRYVFIIQIYPGAGGGLEHARMSVNAVDTSTSTCGMSSASDQQSWVRSTTHAKPTRPCSGLQKASPRTTMIFSRIAVALRLKRPTSRRYRRSISHVLLLFPDDLRCRHGIAPISHG